MFKHTTTIGVAALCASFAVLSAPAPVAATPQVTEMAQTRYAGRRVDPRLYRKLLAEIRALKLHRRKLVTIRNALYGNYVAYYSCNRLAKRDPLYQQLARDIVWYKSINRPHLAAAVIKKARDIGRYTRYCKQMTAKRIAKADRLIWIKQNQIARIRRQVEG